MVSIAIDNQVTFFFQKPDSLDKPDTNRYQVMVYIHGGNFRYGSGQMFPGNIFAEDNIVVVTFNYRLNALGEL
jgi:carboxylesterase type B